MTTHATPTGRPSRRPQAVEDRRAFIRKWLPSKGRHWVAAKLGLSPDTVQDWSAREGVYVGMIGGHMRTPDVAVDADVKHDSVMNAADRAGVLKRLAPGPKGQAAITVVPEAWARAYIAQVQERKRHAALRDAGWLRTSEVSSYLGVSRGQLTTFLRGRGPIFERLPTLRRVHAHSGSQPHLLWHPEDVHALHRILSAERALSRGLVLCSEVDEAMGWSPSYTATLARRQGLGRQLMGEGRKRPVLYLTHQEAEQVAPGWDTYRRA